MNPLYPLFRLGWRWRVPFILVWIGLMFTAIPGGELFENKISPFDVTSFDQLSRPSWIALWRCVFAVPATFAVIVTWLTAEFRMGLYAWTLPDIRKSLTRGMVFAAAVSALPVPLLMARMGYPNTGVVAFFVGLFAFGALCRIVDAAMKHIPSIAIFCAGLLLVYRAGTTGDFTLAHPWVAGSLFLIVAIYCFSLEYLPTTARLRVQPADAQWEKWRLPRFRAASTDLPLWNRPLTRATTMSWALAGFYESYPGSWVRIWALLSPLAFVLIMNGILGTVPKQGGQQYIVSQLMLLSTIGILVRAPVLGRSLLYPLSRYRRALITFWGCVVATIGLVSILFVALCVAAMLAPVTSLLGVSWDGVRLAAREFPLLFAWTPILNWLYVRYAKRAGRVPFPKIPFPMVLVGFGVFLPAILLFSEVEGAPSLMTAVLVALLIVCVQALHWQLLKRFFATADLVWFAGET